MSCGKRSERFPHLVNAVSVCETETDGGALSHGSQQIEEISDLSRAIFSQGSTGRF